MQPGTSTGTSTAAGGSALGILRGSPASLLPEWLFVPGWEYAAAVAVLAVGYVLSRFAARLLGRRVARRFRRQSVAQTVLRLIRISVLAVAAGLAASLLGLEVGDIVLSVTVFSAVLGIVLAPIVGSAVNGLFILADEPYEIGDMIELADGRRGFVDEITIRYTKVYTLDNTSLVIPNASMREQLVTNYSAEDERIRLRLGLLVTYESDVERARTLLEDAARDTEEIIEGGPDIRISSARYPAKPTAYIDEFGDHGILVTLRYWAKRPYRLLTVRSRLQTNLWERIESEPNVEIAYPHQHLLFDDTSGTLRASLSSDDDEEAILERGVDATRDGRASDAREN
jgi:small-conductance mechanosensitive channel